MAKKKETIADLIPDDKNFNKHSTYGTALVEKSLRKFGAGRSILIDKNNKIIAGNATVEGAAGIGIEDLQIVESDGKRIIAVKRMDIDLSTKQGREMALADNAAAKANIVFDAELIEAVLTTPIAVEWGVDVTEAETEVDEEVVAQKLQDRFVVPPFTILDTRQGYWQERKGYWRDIIGDMGESREGLLAKGKQTKYKPGLNTNGASLLDPVLSEIACRWFGVKGGKTFDCFAGDTIFGYVSAHLGNEFLGIELRDTQATLNNLRVKDMRARYICDDGQNVDKHIEPESQDLLFSCPPYYDLEIYSDLPNDASNQDDYKTFLKILDTAFTKAIKCLKKNRFAVITVGDVRGKDGFYYGFPGDIKNIFQREGMPLYNELIMVEPIGNLAMRVGRFMNKRKVGKCHQNILVFYKGNPDEIKDNFPALDLAFEQTEAGEDITETGGGYEFQGRQIKQATQEEMSSLVEYRKKFIKDKFIMYFNLAIIQDGVDKGEFYILHSSTGEISAYLWFRNLKRKDFAKIDEICSTEKGGGTLLMKFAESISAHPTIKLEVVDYNHKAISFYENRGYKNVGERKAGKIKNILMEKTKE